MLLFFSSKSAHCSSKHCLLNSGGLFIPPQVSEAVISEANVNETGCVVTVRWSNPVIDCNGSPSQYVLTVSPPTTECPGECVVERGGVGFVEREQNVTLAVDQMYNFTVRADTCSNTQTGQESEQYFIEMEGNYNIVGAWCEINVSATNITVSHLIHVADSESCQFGFECDLATVSIHTTWKRVFVSESECLLFHFIICTSVYSWGHWVRLTTH